MALLARVAALVVTVAAFVRDPLRLIVAMVLVVLVVVVVMGGWTALVRRGTGRVVGGVVVVLALIGLVVLPSGSLLRMAALVVLVVVSIGAARVALAGDLTEAPADLRPVGPARCGVLLMNPKSGAEGPAVPP